MTSLKQKTINGMIWSVSERLSIQIVQVLVSIILARLLEPADFGLIGMLMLFTAIAQSILDSGFGTALIQKQDATQTDASSIFYFNIVIGFILTGILFLAAPIIASFYKQPILISLTRVLSLSLIINAFSLVHTSLLTKNMDFKAQLKVSIVAVIASGAIGVFMAYQGLGVWSLSAQMISNYLFRAILLWLVNPWRPSFVFSLASLKSMFRYGSRLLVSGLIDTFFRNIYQAFIGKMFSATALGYYTRAATIESAVVNATSTSLSKVTLPALAPFQNENVVLRKAYSRTIKLSLFLHFPLMIGLWAIADPLFRFLLTDKWAPSIPYFQLLCVAGLAYPLQVLNLNVFRVKGRTDLYLKMEIVIKTLIVLSIAVTYRWGIIALLYGQIVTALVSFLIYSYYSGRLIGYKQFDQVRDLIPSFLMAILMGGSMFLAGMINLPSHLFKLIIQTVAGIAVYLLLNLLIKSPELNEAKDIVLEALANLSIMVKRKS